MLSLAVVGELYVGAERSVNADEKREVDHLVATISLLPDDIETARTWAALKNDLRRRGCPIPDNDLWIAAAALRYGLTLATRDRHFEAVSGLSVDRWDDGSDAQTEEESHA